MLKKSELILRLSGYDLRRAEETLNDIHTDKSGVVNQQRNRKWAIFNHHLERNSFYRSLVKKSVTSWDEIPVMTKNLYQQPFHELISDGYKNSQLYIGNTSGSSGHPFTFAKDKFCHALTWALIRQRYSMYDIGLNSMQARFFGIPLTDRSAQLEKWKDKLMNRVRFPVFDLSENRLNGFIDTFRKFRFEYLYGYSNSIRHFCQYLLSKNICLKNTCPTLKCVIVTAEMCNEYDRKMIGIATGVPCVVEYGASETGIIGFEYKDGYSHASDELIYLEVDETGSLLITSLFNRAFPMIRYKIGDQVKLNKHLYDDSMIIEKILGRSDDLIRLPGGKVAAGISIYYCSKYILENMSTIKELYVTQTGMSDFKIFYISDRHLTSDQKRLVKKSFDTYLQPGLKVEFIKTESIRRKANGKLQIFHSELTT